MCKLYLHFNSFKQFKLLQNMISHKIRGLDGVKKGASKGALLSENYLQFIRVLLPRKYHKLL